MRSQMEKWTYEWWHGLRIRETDFTYRDRGAQAVIFGDHEQQRVRKVYRRDDGVGIDHSHKRFAAETEAYRIASETSELQGLVPRYFGLCPPGQVIVHAAGEDVTGEFYPNLAFEA